MVIYHITPRERWESARAMGEYRAPSLESEGFIHASTLEQLVDTANRFYRGQTGLVLLAIDPAQAKPEVRFDPVVIQDQEQKFPHIYGPLNLDAVVEVLDFEPGKDGAFALPPGLTRCS